MHYVLSHPGCHSSHVTELCSLGGRFCCEGTVFVIQTACICHEVGGEVEETVKH